MKKKWTVKYWDDFAECQRKKGFDTYEEAITFSEQTKKKYNVRTEVKLT